MHDLRRHIMNARGLLACACAAFLVTACLGARTSPGASRSLSCTDTYAACPGWGPSSCIYPGVPQDCPCMCGGGSGGGSSGPAPTPTPTPAPTPTPTPSSSGSVLYSSSGSQSGTYYYDVKTQCPQDSNGYPETDGYPSCASYTAGPNQQTLRQIGSNNIVAIDNNVLSSDRAKYCGKKVLVFHNGVQVSAPDGGDFFVWDGCQACEGGGRLDFSVSGLRDVDPNACSLGVVPGVTWQVVDQVVKPFVA